MSDRATHLARQIISRLHVFAAASQDEEKPTLTPEDILAKVMASQGVTDGITLHRLVHALPRIDPRREIPEGDIKDLAAYLRTLPALEF